MKKFTTKAVLVACAMGCMSVQALAGNKDRSGQAGATELLINPWGASNGLFGLNTANVRGLEAMKGNIAGLALADRTEVGFAYTMYLKGSNVGVNNIGISQKVGNAGVLGVNVQSMTFGDITVTDYNNPTGGIGTYKPQFFNFQVGFAKEFSHGVQAGIAATYVTEQISNIRASGACFEAGIQYTTGKRDNFHFGVTLRNVGTNMRFSGPGFSINSDAPENSSYTLDRETPAEKFEMPTYLNIGVAYDIFLDENHLKSEDEKPKHRATIVGAFQSNSFNNDYLGLGVEYSFKEMFMLRGGYRYEKNIGDAQQSTTFYTGISAGASIQYKVGGDKGPMLAIDYAYKPTQRPANGVHTFTLRLTRR